MKKLLLILIMIAFAGTAYAVSFDGKNLTPQEYNLLKLELKTKVANRNIQPLQYKDVRLWIEMINQNLKGCLLKNITKKNIIDSLNKCLN